MSISSTILIVDDNPSVWRALGRLMTSAGYLWKAFPSVEDLIASDQLITADCIVADMTMPGMSGLDLKQHLNTVHSPIPVIFLTAYDTEEMRAAAKEAGAAGFFRKPVDAQALLDAIGWTLNKH